VHKRFSFYNVLIFTTHYFTHAREHFPRRA
jgi:hypothetical protein